MSDAVAPAGRLRRWDESGYPALIARLILGGAFLYLGQAKLADPVQFLKMMREYEMFPPSAWGLMNAAAAWLPWIEVFAGVLLIFGIALRGVALMLITMLVVFTSAVLLRALGIFGAEDIAFCAIRFDCGCGSGEQLACGKLAENTGLIALGLILLFSRSRRFSLRPRLFASKA